MPIYEYQCTACGRIEEVMQKLSDDPPTQCPQCGKDALKKNISAAGFQLSGGGWYASGYQDKSSTTAETTSTDKIETKVETKAAATTEAAATPKPPVAKTTE